MFLAPLSKWILRIACTVLFIKVVEILVPSGRYKKYVNIVTGFIIVTIIITPLIDFLDKGIEFEEINLKNRLAAGRIEELSGGKLLEEVQRKQIIELYKTRMKEHARGLLKESDENVADLEFIIEEDEQSENYGQIKKVLVHTGDKAVKKKEGDITIDNIRVGGNGVRKKEDAVYEKLSADRIKTRISDILGVRKEIVDVENNSDDYRR